MCHLLIGFWDGCLVLKEVGNTFILDHVGLYCALPLQSFQIAEAFLTLGQDDVYVVMHCIDG